MLQMDCEVSPKRTSSSTLCWSSLPFTSPYTVERGDLKTGVLSFCSRLWTSSSSSAANSGNLVSMATNVLQTTNQYEELSDHVYELRPGTNPQIDIVFFHGLPLNEEVADQAFWRIWTKRGTDMCWPVNMLPEYLSTKKRDDDPVGYDPRVLAVSYNSSFKLDANVGNEESDNYLLSESLTSDLILNDNGIGQKRPVILVGHDLGGILIKQLILHVVRMAANDDENSDKLNKFLENLVSVFFYCTPHAGSPAIERLATKIPEETRNQMLQFMSVLGKQMARVNKEFSDFVHNPSKKRKLRTFALYASHNTNQGSFKGEKVCPEGSARQDIDTYYSVEADHYEVCQPKSKASMSMTMLADNIVEVVNRFRNDEKEKAKEEDEAIRYAELQEFAQKHKESRLHDEPIGEASTSSQTT